MPSQPHHFAFSFRTKVLAPVIVVMALLVGTSMWLVNQRVTRQVHADGAQQLTTAEAVSKTHRSFTRTICSCVTGTSSTNHVSKPSSAKPS